MVVLYNKWWKFLVDRKMSKCEQRKIARIVSNAMAIMWRDESAIFSIFIKLCKTFKANYGDIISYVPDDEIHNIQQ